jgi:uroporphyrinogen-III synthase
MPVLIPRDIISATPLMKFLRERGVAVTHVPIGKAIPVACDAELDPLVTSALNPGSLDPEVIFLITSANALRTLSLTRVRQLMTCAKIILTGPATLHVAESLGIRHARCVGERASDMEFYIRQQVGAPAHLIHLSSPRSRLQPEAFVRLGIQFTRVHTYTYVLATNVSELLQPIAFHDPTLTVLVYSSAIAQALLRYLREKQLPVLAQFLVCRENLVNEFQSKYAERIENESNS